jgi:hypothetical protein
MSKLMEDAFKNAYAKNGLVPPVSEATSRHSQPVSVNHQRKSQPAKQPPTVDDKWQSGAKELRTNARTLSQTAKNSANKPKTHKTIKQSQPVQPIKDQKIYADIADDYGSNKKMTKPEPPLEPWTLTITPDATTHPFLSKELHEYQVIPSMHNGIAEQFSENDGDADVRDMVIGLDFGTSSVKVVVGDRSAGIAYAVPFSNVEGIDGYLLPSRLWQTDDQFSLLGGKTVHRDLKLTLLLHDDNPEQIERAIALLALVIRHVRGWLFSEHAEIYSNTKMVWKLVLGIPAANYEIDPENPALVSKFRLIAKAAWLVAGNDKEEMLIGSITQAVSRAKDLLAGDASKSESEEVEVDVVPELSAQIYGFCVSQNFDKNAENIFMTVDVGAGTIDSSLFQVKKGERGKWDFEFVTNQVQQNGVMNLHRTRVKWWSDALAGRADPASQLAKELNKNKSHTDHHGIIPDSMDDYLTGVSLKFRDAKNHPDAEFFSKRVVGQVRRDTHHLAWKSGYLDEQQLTEIPMFLCGGGIRMPYYQKLEQTLAHIPNTTWLKATKRSLVKPSNLIAHGLADSDYDRLSVAFGLSFLEVGTIVRALAKPKATSNIPIEDYTAKFISKDVC